MFLIGVGALQAWRTLDAEGGEGIARAGLARRAVGGRLLCRRARYAQRLLVVGPLTRFRALLADLNEGGVVIESSSQAE